jgi:hypothetical protein
MVSRFKPVLPILKGNAGERLGLCAMGPVDPGGDEIIWMRVWLWQKDGKKVAACFGTSGEHPGSHPLAATEKLPFKPKKDWMIQTELEPHSKQFTKGKPALAMAMAMVKHADGSVGVEEWSQAVMVAKQELRADGYRRR